MKNDGTRHSDYSLTAISGAEPADPGLPEGRFELPVEADEADPRALVVCRARAHLQAVEAVARVERVGGVPDVGWVRWVVRAAGVDRVRLAQLQEAEPTEDAANPYTVSTHVLVPEEDVRRLRALSARTRIAQSDYLREAVEDLLKKYGADR